MQSTNPKGSHSSDTKMIQLEVEVAETVSTHLATTARRLGVSVESVAAALLTRFNRNSDTNSVSTPDTTPDTIPDTTPDTTPVANADINRGHPRSVDLAQGNSSFSPEREIR
jgi:DNA-binding CsgD family transcriptional regulator